MKNRAFRIGLVLGTPIVALGIADALGDSGRTKPFELAVWVLGGILLVDLVVVPIALGIGRLVGRRAELRCALAASAIIVVVGWPFVQGYGRQPGNPSLLPRDYGTGVTVALGAVWVSAGIVWAIRERRRGALRLRAWFRNSQVEPPSSTSRISSS